MNLLLVLMVGGLVLLVRLIVVPEVDLLVWRREWIGGIEGDPWLPDFLMGWAIV